MTQSQSIEMSAADVETAIEQGIAKLGVSRDQVMVEVLEEPSKGLLGLGGRNARVKLTVIGLPPPPAPPPSQYSPSQYTPSTTSSASAPPTGSPAAPSRMGTPRGTTPPQRYNRPDRPDHRPGRSERGDRGERPAAQDYQQRSSPRPYADLDELDDEGEVAPASFTPADLAEDAKVGAEVLGKLLHHMQISAAVSPRQSEISEGEAEHWILEITGQDLGLLIGRRGETLASLQYITRLITSRELGRRANIVIDVEGYKARRETMLKRLAKKMAEQAIQRGRTVALEPMPPHERRIIHMVLRENPDVTTESVGEGDHRKVTIIPRRQRP